MGIKLAEWFRWPKDISSCCLSAHLDESNLSISDLHLSVCPVGKELIRTLCLFPNLGLLCIHLVCPQL